MYVMLGLDGTSTKNEELESPRPRSKKGTVKTAAAKKGAAKQKTSSPARKDSDRA